MSDRISSLIERIHCPVCGNKTPGKCCIVDDMAEVHFRTRTTTVEMPLTVWRSICGMTKTVYEEV